MSTHYRICQDENCEEMACVDRRDAQAQISKLRFEVSSANVHRTNAERDNLTLKQRIAELECHADKLHKAIQILTGRLLTIGHREEPENIAGLAGDPKKSCPATFGYLLACEHIIADAEKFLTEMEAL